MNLLQRKARVVLLSMVFLVPLSLAQAALVFEDNFDTENGGTPVNPYGSFANWTSVGPGTVDLHGLGGIDPLPGNGLYVDLDGTGSGSGRLETIQTFGPGDYQLDFDLAGAIGLIDFANDLVTVSFGAGLSETFAPVFNSPFSTFTRNVTVAPGDTANLVVDHAVHAGTGDGGGPHLDNVTINMIPEPSSLLLGLVALPFILWRKGRS